MLTIFVCALLFALFYAIKGGAHGTIRRRVNAKLTGAVYAQRPDGGWGLHPDSTTAQKAVDRILDGKIFSSLGVATFMVFFGAKFEGFYEGMAHYSFADDALIMFVLAFGAWMFGVAPSMGEEGGACGGYKGAWGEYTQHFNRSYGIKKALQRGLWTTVFIGILLGSPLVILSGAMLVPCYWLGISYLQWKHQTVSVGWPYAEWLYGGVIGMAIGLAKVYGV